MSEKGPSIYEKTTKLREVVTLFINKEVYEGWEDVQITKELNACAGDFQLSITDKWREDKADWRIQPQSLVHIHLAGKSFITGWVESVDVSFSSNSRTITIGGRSKTGDLVDSSVTGANEYSNLSLLEIATMLCKPFDIRVKALADVGAKFEKITVQQGETVFALIDRLARQRKIILSSSAEGELLFTKQGTAKSKTELRQGVNILSGKATVNTTDRFSNYIVKGQNVAFLGNENDSTSPEGESNDEGMGRYRPLVMLNETLSDGGSARDRASYEAHARLAKSLQVEIEVQGWLKEDGQPWSVNELVDVDAPFLGVRKTLLIKKAVFNKSNGGTTTQLSLVRNDAYLFEKAIKKKKDKEDAFGWTKDFTR
jgi:prophage tail gpP-like protein